MWDSDIMLNNKFLSVYRSSCRIPTQKYCKIILSMYAAMCMCIPCNIYVALGARGLNCSKQRKLLIITIIKLELHMIVNFQGFT